MTQCGTIGGESSCDLVSDTCHLTSAHGCCRLPWNLLHECGFSAQCGFQLKLPNGLYWKPNQHLNLLCPFALVDVHNQSEVKLRQNFAKESRDLE